jgi:hypothetical protein
MSTPTSLMAVAAEVHHAQLAQAIELEEPPSVTSVALR